jgi:CRISPR-associated protein Cas1
MGGCMKQLIIDKKDISLDFSNNCVVVKSNEAGQTIPIKYIRQVICFHNVQISTRLLGLFNENGIDFCVINNRYTERTYGLYGNQFNDGKRRLSWYKVLSIPVIQRQISQYVVKLKVTKQRTFQRYMGLTPPLRTNIGESTNLSQLLGIEGSQQRQYWQWYKQLFNSNLEFNARLRRPPPDPVNACLSLAYTLLYHNCTRAIIVSGLDPYLGCYHVPSHGRYSLSCDLMEPMRVIVDYFVWQLFANEHLNSRHFSQANGQCLLLKEGRLVFYQHWDKHQEYVMKTAFRYVKRLLKWLSVTSNSVSAKEHFFH